MPFCCLRSVLKEEHPFTLESDVIIQTWRNIKNTFVSSTFVMLTVEITGFLMGLGGRWCGGWGVSGYTTSVYVLNILQIRIFY